MMNLRLNNSLLCTFLLLSFGCFSQNQKKADSLVAIIESNTFLDDSLKFETSRMIAYYHPEPGIALHYAQKAFEIANAKKQVLNIAKALDMIGVNNRILGNKETGFEASYQALKIYDSLKLPYRQAMMHLHIGEHHVEDENYKEGIFNILNSILLLDSLGRSNKVLAAKLNLGEAFRLSGNLDSAVETFEEVLDTNTEFGNLIIQTYASGNLGMAYHSLKDYQRAKKYLVRALETIDPNDAYAISVYKAELGLILINQGRKREGEQIIMKALDLAKESDLKKQVRDISNVLSEYYSSEKKYKEAFIFQRQFQVYNDSLINVENIRRIQQIGYNYELDKKSLKISSLTLENQLAESTVQYQELVILFAGVGLALMGIITVLSITGLVQKRKSNLLLGQKNAIITQQVRDKEMLHREIHHRVKNNLQLMSSIMGLQSQTSENDQVSRAMSISKTRVEAMSIVHQNLFMQEKNSQINVKSYLGKLIDNLRSTYINQIGHIEVESSDTEISADEAVPIGLIVNEVVCNTVKHQNENHLKINVRFISDDRGKHLRIEDNGKKPLNSNKSVQGFGMGLIETLARQLQATLQYSNLDNGTSVALFMKPLK